MINIARELRELEASVRRETIEVEKAKAARAKGEAVAQLHENVSRIHTAEKEQHKLRIIEAWIEMEEKNKHEGIVSVEVIHNDIKEIELGIKRFYIPITLKFKCPNCGKEQEFDLSDDPIWLFNGMNYVEQR